MEFLWLIQPLCQTLSMITSLQFNGLQLACEIPLNNGPSFQEFKYLWPLKWKIPNSSPLIVIWCCLFLKKWINLEVLVQMKYLVSLLQIVLYQLHFILFQLHLIILYIANGIFPRRLEVRKGYFFIQVSGKRGNIDNYHAIWVISIIGKYLKESSIINCLKIYRIMVLCLSTKIRIPCAQFNSYNCSMLWGSSHAYRVLSTTSSYRPL